MSNRENPTVDTLLVAAIAIGCISVAAMIMPAGSTSEASTASAASHAAADGAGYLPAQVVSQAREIQPLPPTF